MTSPSSLPVAVLGAGAAGLLASLTAARRGVPVVLLESTADGGRKILISGGGRCNILPSVAQFERYVTDSSRNTLRKILLSWPLVEQRAFFERELRMPMMLEEESGKLFPASQRARDVRDGLMAAVREAGAEVRFGARAVGLRRDGTRWTVEIENAEPVVARAVVVATGGLSVPKTGSDGAGLAIVETLGHEIVPTYPALAPLTADPHPHAELSGISARVTLTAPGAKPAFRTTDALLITHRGWSGPAVLDASHLTARRRPDGTRQELRVAWTELGEDDWDTLLRSRAGTLRSVVAAHLPRRLASALIEEAGAEPDMPLAELPRAQRRSVVAFLTAYPLPWTGDEGYRKAEVTGGGVALGEIDPRTMESRRAPGLHLCGEILDVFGPIGGHNFLWAWASGRAAGAAV